MHACVVKQKRGWRFWTVLVVLIFLLAGISVSALKLLPLKHGIICSNSDCAHFCSVHEGISIIITKRAKQWKRAQRAIPHRKILVWQTSLN